MRSSFAAAFALLAATAGCSSASVGDMRPDPQGAAAAGAFRVERAERADEPAVPSRVRRASCPSGMVDIEGRYCIDKYEASLVEVLDGGAERPFSPYSTLDAKTKVRAVSAADVYPQGYVSARQAARACAVAGKRLCRATEWVKACRGPEGKAYGYADRREPGRCNDRGKSPVVRLFGRRWNKRTLNQPILNRMEGTLARTGEHGGCSNGYGVYDMVGNLHEWVADARGSFRGGYYLDVASVGHGSGCGYVTNAHETRYHDYSTGFRCCADRSGD